MSLNLLVSFERYSGALHQSNMLTARYSYFEGKPLCFFQLRKILTETNITNQYPSNIRVTLGKLLRLSATPLRCL